MTKPTDAAEVEAIRTRCDAATEGPWRVRDRRGGYMPTVEDALGRELTQVEYDGSYAGGAGASFWEEADVAFVAHARTDIPALLALVDTQAQEIERLQDGLFEIAKQHTTDELSPEMFIDADFEGAYDACVETARSILKDTRPTQLAADQWNTPTKEPQS